MPVFGIDVSQWRGEISWPQVAASGLAAFASTRIIDGDTPDSRWQANAQGARDHIALPIVHARVKPGDQAICAARFLDMTGSIHDLATVGLMVDVEDVGVTVADGMAFCRAVHDLTGRWPLAYVPAWWLARQMDEWTLPETPWWPSRYVPEPWTPEALEAIRPPLHPGFGVMGPWQFTSSGAVAGVPPPVDRNVFFGTEAELGALLRGVMPMQLVSRAGWGARPPRNRQSLDRSAQRGTAVHYTASDADEQASHANCAGRVRGIQQFHMDGNGWADIAYSFLACKHGTVYEGRGRGIRTAAQGTDAGNDGYHAVCFLGDDTAGRDDVTDAGRQAIADAVRHCNAWAGVDEVRPHSSFKATACPGDQLRAFVAAGMPTTTEEDDMFEQPDRDKLAAIHSGLIVPGTTSPDQTIDKLFERVRSIEQGMVVPGTTSVGQAFELLFDRVRTIEAAVTAPPEPLPEGESVPFVLDSAAAAAALAGDAGFLAAVAKAVNDDAARRQAE
jgi:hypothetical protein